MAYQYILLFILVFTVHAAVSWLAGQWFYSRFPDDKSQSRVWQWMGFVFSFFMPVCGLIGISMVYLLLRNRPNSKDGLISIRFDEHMRQDTIAVAEAEEGEEPCWKEVKEIQPMVDALTDMDIELQKGAIDSLAVKQDPASIKTLVDSLDYTVPEVRYFTVEALAKISKTFSDKITAAKLEVGKHPGSVNNRIELADCYYEYGISNVEDSTLSLYYLKQAADLYYYAIQHTEDNTSCLIRFGEVIKRMGRYQDALDVFNKVYSRDASKLDVLLNLMEIYFQQGKIKELAAVASQIKDYNNPLPEDVQKAISLWI